MEQKLAQLKAKLEADSSFVEKISEMESSEQVQSLFKTEGMDFTLEEIDTLKDAFAKSAVQGASGELADEDLENVAGGGIFSTIFNEVWDLGTAVHRRSGGRW